MKNFIFTDDVNTIAMEDSFQGIVPLGVSGVGNLMDAVAEAMKFPAYFGENWNALSDCLRDFCWIDERNVLLIHKEIPDIESDELIIYINVLNDSIGDWKQEDEHELFVILPSDSERSVLGMLA